MTKEEMLKETHDTVIRLETKMEFALNHLHNVDQNVTKLNERTGKNERSISKIYGIGAAAVFLIGLGITLIGVFA